MTDLHIRQFKNQKPVMGDRCFIDPQACIIGNVALGDDVSIWPMVVLRGDLEKITISDRSNIQDGTVIHTTQRSDDNPEGYPTTLGCDVTVGHGAILHGCNIGDRVLVGIRASVLDGAVVPSDTMIGAGGLVTPGKQLKSGYLYMGSPVKAARELTDDELAFLKISAQNYITLKDKHLGC